MCGVAGVIRKKNSSKDLLESSSEIVRQMILAMASRGPDGLGEYQGSQVKFAMCRLSIIGLDNGWQPIYSESKKHVLICNGEIYNYKTLVNKLENLGHKFQTDSDCEVIIHLYEEYGMECVKYLRGMFAFAIYDIEADKVYLARDRLGEKPLYLYQTEDSLVFASEMKGLLSSGAVPFELDPASIDKYFHFGYVPDPFTPIKNVHKLGAGTYLEIHLESWSFKTITYWSIESIPSSDVEPIGAIRLALEESIDCVMQADVPVGIALSSGLDSSVIAALAVNQGYKDIEAFSLGYKGAHREDERLEAKRFAEYLKIPFHSIEISIEDMVENFVELNFHRDDPIADISGFGYYAVMRFAHAKKFPVMLQGQGGDELFFGYEPFMSNAVKLTEIKKSIIKKEGLHFLEFLNIFFEKPKSLKSAIGSAINFYGLKNGLKHYMNVFSSDNTQRMILYDLEYDFNQATAEIKNYYSKNFLNKIPQKNSELIFSEEHPWDEISTSITSMMIKGYLLENGITQGERLAMASSVELRLPFVDYRLVETVIGCRKFSSDHLDKSKYWLKSAVKDLVPQWVMERPKKGFSPPIREWYEAIFNAYGGLLKRGKLVEYDVLSEDAAEYLSRGLCPPGAIMPISFKALVLECWVRKMRPLCK